jgi:tetratricopeptide (TPR) repeat protein
MVAERALMFASLSFCIGLSYLLIRLFVNENQNPEKPKSKKVSLSLQLTTPRFALIGVVLVIFSGVSIARNADWKDTITLFEADMPHLENSARANYMMAKEIRRLYRINNQLTKEKLSEESAKAIHYYNQAIKAYPEYAQAMEELGMIYAVEQRNISMAIPVFEKAISIDSTLWRSASNLGMAYQISKDTASSVKWYEHSLKIRPNNPKVLVELAKLYYTAGRKQDALKCNSQLMKLNPESNIPYYNYAIYYMMEQDTPTAVKYFEQDIKYGEKEEFPYYFLFTHYMQQSDTLNALRIKRQAQAVRR